MDPLKSKRMAVFYAGLVFLLLAVFTTLALVKRTQELRQRAAAETTLYLEPVDQSIDQGEEFEVAVKMRTGANQITRADVTLNYDEQYLKGLSFTAGTFMPTVEAEGIVQSGIANIILTADELTPATGDDTIATLKFSARNPVEATTISFSADTVIAAVGETENVFTGGESATISVNRTVHPEVKLQFSPEAYTVRPGAEFGVDVEIDTGTNRVTTANLQINYDSSKLGEVRIENGGFLEDIIKGRDEPDFVFADGTGAIKLGTSSSGKTGTGTLARFIFQAKDQDSASQLVVSSQTVITAQGTDENMLAPDGRGTAQVTVGAVADPTPEPTPDPTPEPTPPGTGGTNPPPPQTECEINPAPLAPTGVYVAGTDRVSVTLTWDYADRASRYGIVYGRSPGRYEYGAANVGNVTSYTVRGLAANTTYYFAVFAGNDCGASGFSVETSGRTVISGGFGTYTQPDYEYEEAEPDPLFVPIEPDTPSDESFFPDYFDPTPSPVASLVPSPSPTAARTFGLFSPLGGILLIVAALFLGIFFLRMRSS